MQKEIIVHQDTPNKDFILSSKIMARRVLTDLHPEFNFWLHKSLTEGYEFTVSEGSCGASIANGLTEKSALKNARANLTKHDISIIRNLIKEKKEFVDMCKKSFLNDPLWNALSSAVFTATELELSDIRASLAFEGYEIKKIDKS